MKNRIWWIAIGLLAGLMLVAASAVLLTRPFQYHGSLLDPPAAAPDFSLTDQREQPFHLEAQAGRAQLVFFGYTSCPDVCPTALAMLRRVRDRLGAQADQVQVLLVTVDPARDTPARLAEYLAQFDPSFIGLTGSPEALASVWQSYGIFRQELSGQSASGGHGGHDGTDYLVDHTVRIFLIDPQGRLRLTYTLEVSTQDLARDVQEILR